MQSYLQVKVGDKSIETHVLIKRDQQSERELHTDARDANARSQRACFAGGKKKKAVLCLPPTQTVHKPPYMC